MALRSVPFRTTLGLLAAVALCLPPVAAAHHDDGAPHSHGPDSKALDKRGRVPGATYQVDAHVAWSTSQYDGQALETDHADLTALPTFHAVYVYPSNGVNRFAQFAAMFQADARDASARLAPYGRALRFDEREGGYLDITVVRSRHNAKKLGGGQQFSLVAQELKDLGFTSPNKKYVAWLDAASRYCGQGELWQDTRRSSANNNELRTTAIVYRPYSTGDAKTGGFCRGRTLAHELGHNMGALQRAAPNAFDGAHCDDSAEDVMCYTSATSLDTGGPAFDWQNDDYWDPAAAGSSTKLGWWTVNLSRFVCPPAGCGEPNSNPGY